MSFYRLIDGSVASYISVLYLNMHQSVATYIIQEAPYIYLNLQQSAPLSLLSLSLISLLSSLPISLPQAAAPSLPCALSPKAGSHPFECLPVFSHAVAPPLYPLAGGAISPSPRLSIWSDVKENLGRNEPVLRWLMLGTCGTAMSGATCDAMYLPPVEWFLSMARQCLDPCP